MRVKWLGHSAFLITSQAGTKVITDPYAPAVGLSYGPIKEAADIVTVSHGHGDHNNAAALPGSPLVIKGVMTKKVKDVELSGVATFHDEDKGSQRGSNTVFCFTIDGMKVCHLGDLGHTLSPEQAAAIGEVDILLIPVGGYYTIDAEAATQTYLDLKPKVVVPMHFKTPKCGFPISSVDDFLRGKTNAKKVGTSEVEFTREKLPVSTEIVVLTPAL